MMKSQEAPMTPRRPSRPLQSGSPKTQYLILYNLVSALLWLGVLGRVITINLVAGHTHVFAGTGEFVKWTQTLAGLEIIHAAAGVVRAPIATTAMQVASRFLLVWAVVGAFPDLALSPAYSTMLAAWSVTEVIRYAFFTLSVSGLLPGFLNWLRYSTFLVLYPMGISSECWLIYKATAPAGRVSQEWAWVLWAILVAYVPGSYIMFTYMMAQREKVLKGKQRKQ